MKKDTLILEQITDKNTKLVKSEIFFMLMMMT